MEITKAIPLQVDAQTLRKKQEAQLKEAANMYEQHFLNDMVKAMRPTINREEGMLQPNFAEKIFTEQLDQEYVKGWADKGGIGLADMIFQQLKEKIFPDQHGFQRPQGPLPVDRANSSFEIKVDKKGPTTGQVIFKGDATSPLVQALDVTAPWEGKMVSQASTGDGWVHTEIAHKNGETSSLAYKGVPLKLAAGESLEAGQKLGTLSLDEPLLRWDLKTDGSPKA